MADEIILRLGQTAEPDTCGSCKFFKRLEDRYPVGQGRCAITLPPMFATKYDLPGVEVQNSWQFDLKQDIERCDLQKPDRNTYIVQRKVGV